MSKQAFFEQIKSISPEIDLIKLESFLKSLEHDYEPIEENSLYYREYFSEFDYKQAKAFVNEDGLNIQVPYSLKIIECLENYSGKPEKSETVEDDRIFHIFTSFPIDNNFSEWERDYD